MYFAASMGSVKAWISYSVSRVSSVRMLVRIMASSSTSTMVVLRFSGTRLNSFSFLLQGNSDVEGGPAPDLAFEIDGAAMGLGHDLPHDQQAQPRADAQGLGREALFQHLLAVRLPDAPPRVGNPDMHRIAFEAGTHGDRAGAFDGLAGGGD